MAHRDSKFEFDRRGVLFVLSSPSGAGKSTIARKLLEVEPGMGVSVSATTRPIREGERAKTGSAPGRKAEEALGVRAA